MEQLITILQTWDDKRVAYAKAMYQQLYTQSDFITNLIAITEQFPKLRHNTTWLIKHHADQNGTFTKEQSHDIAQLLSNLNNWAEKLHILQTMPSLHISEEDFDTWESFIGEHLDYSQNFVRTSAYHGLYVLSQYQTEMKPDILVIFKEALESDSAASVRARLRKLIKWLEKEMK